MKIWGYSLLVSMIIGIYDLINPQAEPPAPARSSTGNEKSGATSNTEANAAELRSALATKRQAIFKQMAIDVTDFVIPLYVANWYPVATLTMGVAGSINGLLGAHSAWDRLNG